MPVLRDIRKRVTETRPLKGIRIAACLHVTSETTNFAETLKSLAAQNSPCVPPTPSLLKTTSPLTSCQKVSPYSPATA